MVTKKRAGHIVEALPFPDLLTTKEAAILLKRKPQTLRSWAALENGPIRPIRINGRLAWPRSELEKLVPVPVEVSIQDSYAYINASAENWKARNSKGEEPKLAVDSLPLAEVVMSRNTRTMDQLRTDLAGAYALASRVEIALMREEIGEAKQKLNSLLTLLEQKCEDNEIFERGNQ